MKKKLISLLLALSFALSAMPMTVYAAIDELADTQPTTVETTEPTDMQPTESETTEPTDTQPTESETTELTDMQPTEKLETAETGEASNSQNKAEATNITIRADDPTECEFAINELDAFDPKKEEYHIQTSLEKNLYRYINISVANPNEGTELKIVYTGYDGTEAEIKNQAVVNENISHYIGQPRPGQTEIPKLKFKLTNGDDTAEYTVYLHTASIAPVGEFTYSYTDSDENIVTVDPAFDVDHTNDSVNVYITPETPDDADLKATFALAYGIKTDWDGSVKLSNGAAEVDVKMWINDESQAKTVKYKFYRDSDTTLKSLTADGDHIFPVDNDVHEFVCYLPENINDGDAFKVEAAANSNTAKVEYSGGTVENGRATVVVTVTAGDGTQSIYAVNAFSRNAEGNGLQALQLFHSLDYKLTAIPFAFDPQTKEYTVEYRTENTQESGAYRKYFAFCVLPNRSTSTVRVQSYSYDGGSGYEREYTITPDTINIVYLYSAFFDYYNPIHIIVTDENGDEVTYTVTVRNKDLPLSSNADLTGMEYRIPGAKDTIIIENFDKSTTEYELELPYGTESIELIPHAKNPGATFSSLTIPVSDGSEARLTVTAADGETTKEYTFTCKLATDSAYLSSLSYSCGERDEVSVPAFDKKRNAYQIILPDDVKDGTKITLNAIPEKSGVKVEIVSAEIKDGRGAGAVVVTDGALSMKYSVYFHVGTFEYSANDLSGFDVRINTTLDSYKIVGDLEYFSPEKTEYKVGLYVPKNFAFSENIIMKPSLPEGSSAKITVHYHQNINNEQCVRDELINGEEYKSKGPLIRFGEHQDVTVTVTPETGEAKVYTFHFYDARKGVSSVDETDRSMYAPRITSKESGYVINDGTNSYTTKIKTTYNIPYNAGVKNGDTIELVLNFKNFCIEREPVYTAVLENNTAEIPIVMTNADGEAETVVTFTVKLSTEEESICEFSQLYYETEDGEIHFIPLDGVDTSSDFVSISVTVDEKYSDSEKIVITGVNKVSAGTVTSEEQLSYGSCRTMMIVFALNGNMRMYDLEFTLATPTTSNAYAGKAYYKIGESGETRYGNFNSTGYEYFILLDSDQENPIADGTEVSIQLEPKYAGAKIVGESSAIVKDGYAQIKLTVVSADGNNQNAYTFHFAHSFEDKNGGGFESITYKIDGNTQEYKVNGVSTFGTKYTVNLPYGTPDNAVVNVTPILPSTAAAEVVGDNSVTLENGKGSLQWKITTEAGYVRVITLNVQISDELMSVYEYLPIGSQYTNQGFGTKPLLYKKGDKLTAPPDNWGSCQTVGNFGGYMTYQLTTPLKNDPANPYGIDFIVYGNGQGSTGYMEPASIWVAQDKDGDGQPDKWFELAGSAYFDATTTWNYEITYSKGDFNSTDYETSDGITGNLKYEYPDIDRYGALGAVVDPDSITLRGTLLHKDLIPRFGYADVHPNDDGDMETPLNPYDGSNPMFAGFGSPLNGIARGDGMDISWAVDENGEAVYLDEITFVRINNASFVELYGERSAEIHALVPLYDNAGKAPVGVTEALEKLTFKAKDGEDITVELTEGQTSYDIMLPNISDYSLYFDEAVRTSKHIYINNDYADENGYALSKTISVDSGIYKMRVVVQEGEKEPLLYYLTLREESAAKWKITFDANGGLLDGSSSVIRYYRDTDVGNALPIPELLRFAFDGWYTADGVQYTTIVNEMPSNLTLTARWRFVGLPETTDKISVSFALIGSTLADLVDEDDTIDLADGNYKGARYEVWIDSDDYSLNENATVYDLFRAAVDGKLSFTGAKIGYVDTIYSPSGYELSEFTNGKRSGWMYTVNGLHPRMGLLDYKLSDGDVVIWHYVNDYSYEVADWFSGDPEYPSLGDGTYYNSWLKAFDNHYTPDDPSTLPDKPVDGDKKEEKKPLIDIEKDPKTPSIIFTDTMEHWAKEEIREIYEYGIMKGITQATVGVDGTLEALFAPDMTLTRAMFVTMLYRMDGEKAVDNTAPFDDIVSDSWYSEAVAWAYANDIVKGTSDSAFSPDKEVTREEIAVFIMRFVKYKGADIQTDLKLENYKDVITVDAWAADAMAFAVEKELIRGRSETELVPQGQATRAEAAVILLRMIKNLVK